MRATPPVTRARTGVCGGGGPLPSAVLSGEGRRSHSKSRLARTDPVIPNATAKMTIQFWSSAMEELSVSRTSGLTGYWSCQVGGYGPEADGTEEPIDQGVGTPSAVTWTYSCTGRLQLPLRPLTARYSPSAFSGAPGKAPVSGHDWAACGPCHRPHGPVQLCWTGPEVTPVTPRRCPRGESRPIKVIGIRVAGGDRRAG